MNICIMSTAKGGLCDNERNGYFKVDESCVTMFDLMLRSYLLSCRM